MIRKRGNITVNEMVTAVIAIICLSVLIFAIVKLYQNLAVQEIKKAQTGLNSIIVKMNALQDEESTYLSLATGLTAPWFIAGWNGDEVGRPEKCYLGSCICICKGEAKKERGDMCANNGICQLIGGSKKVSVIEKGYLVKHTLLGLDCEKNDKGIPNIFFGKSSVIPLTISLRGDTFEVARIYDTNNDCENEAKVSYDARNVPGFNSLN